MTTDKATSNRTGIKYRAVITLLSALAHLPLPLLYLFSDAAYVVIYHLVRYRRATVRGNLRRAFPQMPPRELLATERRFYHHLCDCIVETVKLLHISDAEINRRVEVHHAELADKRVEEGHSVVLFLGHYGNWEWVQAIGGHLTGGAVKGQIYSPLHNAVMDRVMLRIRSRFGLECIPKKKALRRIFEIERGGEKFIIGFISDQRPSGKNLHYWTDFLGLDTPYMAGGEMLGERVDAAYLYLDIEKTARGHYRLTFRPVVPDAEDKDANPYTRQFMKMLETTIRRAPEYWLWSHKRWKKTREK